MLRKVCEFWSPKPLVYNYFRGQCVDTNTCVCNRGYQGVNCALVAYSVTTFYTGGWLILEKPWGITMDNSGNVYIGSEGSTIKLMKLGYSSSGGTSSSKQLYNYDWASGVQVFTSKYIFTQK